MCEVSQSHLHWSYPYHYSNQRRRVTRRTCCHTQHSVMAMHTLTLQDCCFPYLQTNEIYKSDTSLKINYTSDLNQMTKQTSISTFPSSDQMCSHRWGQIGAKSKVWTSMNRNTSSLCIPSIASSRYLSFAAWKKVNVTTINTILCITKYNCHGEALKRKITQLFAPRCLQNVRSLELNNRVLEVVHFSQVSDCKYVSWQLHFTKSTLVLIRTDIKDPEMPSQRSTKRSNEYDLPLHIQLSLFNSTPKHKERRVCNSLSEVECFCRHSGCGLWSASKSTICRELCCYLDYLKLYWKGPRDRKHSSQ